MASQTKAQPCLPFLRWAGGKRWLAALLSEHLRAHLLKSGGRYIEPFLGAGAMFFALAPFRCILSDTNAELINCFKQVRDQPDYILSRLRRIPVTATAYYAVRESSPRTDRGRAVRTIYLNRTCYGGLYRTNLRGEFNVPYGGGSRTPATLWRDGLLRKVSQVLKESRCALRCSDFQEQLQTAREGDVVYCDPAYRGMTRGTFDRYGATIFGWDDQERLKQAAQAAMRRGALVLISNSANDELNKLYSSALQLKLRRSKTIGNRAINSATHRELLAIFDPDQRRDYWLSIRSSQILSPRKPAKIDSEHGREAFSLQLSVS